MNDQSITLILSSELAHETLMALRARQRATGSGTPGFKLCAEAIAKIEAASKSPETLVIPRRQRILKSITRTDKGLGDGTARITESPEI
jgi:hypothetical protein